MVAELPETIEHWARRDRLAVSCVACGELATGGRTRDAVEEDSHDFEKIPLEEHGRSRVAGLLHPRTGGGAGSSPSDERPAADNPIPRRGF